MKEIKICGMMRNRDIDYVNSLKPDFVGFILAPSKRKISIERCKELVNQLDRGIGKVGVFVNKDSNEINHIMSYCNLDIVQLHGEERPQDCRTINKEVWKVFRVKDKVDQKTITTYNVDGYLLDTYHKNVKGGTGISFSWELIKGVEFCGKTILAGGITVENIEEAIKLKDIDCIDVSSGVEIGGFKDYNKMKELIERVKKS